MLLLESIFQTDNKFVIYQNLIDLSTTVSESYRQYENTRLRRGPKPEDGSPKKGSPMKGSPKKNIP